MCKKDPPWTRLPSEASMTAGEFGTTRGKPLETMGRKATELRPQGRIISLGAMSAGLHLANCRKRQDAKLIGG